MTTDKSPISKVSTHKNIQTHFYNRFYLSFHGYQELALSVAKSNDLICSLDAPMFHCERPVFRTFLKVACFGYYGYYRFYAVCLFVRSIGLLTCCS